MLNYLVQPCWVCSQTENTIKVVLFKRCPALLGSGLLVLKSFNLKLYYPVISNNEVGLTGGSLHILYKLQYIR